MLLEHRNIALKNGIILSFFLIFMTSIIYVVDSQLLHQGIIHSMLFYGIFCLFPVFIIQQKTLFFFGFKVVFSCVFLILATALFVYMIFILLLYNVIDANLITDYINVASIHLELLETPDYHYLDSIVFNTIMQAHSQKSNLDVKLFKSIGRGSFTV